VDLQSDKPAEKYADYEVTPCSPTDLSDADIEVCFALIEAGKAVDVDTMKRDFPHSTVLAIVRKGDQIVGVGAIKRIRERYAAKVARNSEVDFPSNTQELGYVGVDEHHRRRGLSYRLVETLLSNYANRLFATTDAEWMKRALSKYGFSKKGKEWQGERAVLSYWERM